MFMVPGTRVFAARSQQDHLPGINSTINERKAEKPIPGYLKVRHLKTSFSFIFSYYISYYRFVLRHIRPMPRSSSVSSSPVRRPQGP